MDEVEKICHVDRWLSDVSASLKRWNTLKDSQSALERNILHLKDIDAKTDATAFNIKHKISEAVEKNTKNVLFLADAAEKHSILAKGFYLVINEIEPPEVAEAWRLHFIDGKTWIQCAKAIHYNRQHLERLSRTAKIKAYDLMPKEYR